MLRRLAPSLALAMLLPTGCVLAPIDLAGRACDERDRCAEGWTCDVATRRCVMGEVVDGGNDAPAIDAAAASDAPEIVGPDSGLDAHVVDGGSDAWSIDDAPSDAPDAASSDAPLDASVVADTGRATDAGTIACTPTCHPSETCVGGVCELVGYTPHAPGTAISVTFEPTGVIDLRTIASTVRVVRIAATPPGGRGSCTIRLPGRAASNPLIVTNDGGQVRCARLVLDDGSGWALTGRYQPASATALATGHVSVRGHELGYARTRGQYGFYVTEELVIDLDPAATGPVNFEVEYVELSQAESNTGRGLVVTGGVDDTYVIDDASIHDCYVHDTALDGSFGGTNMSPGTTATRFAFYRNRVLRAGGPCLSGVFFGDGSVVRENVFASCGMAAAENDTGTIDRDFPIDLKVRSGSVRFERNVVLGTRAAAMRVYDIGEAPAGAPTVYVRDSTFSALGNEGLRLQSQVGLPRGATLFVTGSSFSRFRFARTELVSTAMMPSSLVTLGANGNAIVTRLTDVHWDSSFGGSGAFPAGYTGMATDVGMSAVAPVVFADYLPAVVATLDDLVLLERWARTRQRPMPADPRNFLVDRLVAHQGNIFEARATTTVMPPSGDWGAATTPSDDVRTAAPYDGMGIGP